MIEQNKNTQNTNSGTKQPLFIYGVMWRLSAVFFLVFTAILVVTYMPIKWVVTGKWHLDSNKQTNRMYKWGKKCGF